MNPARMGRTKKLFARGNTRKDTKKEDSFFRMFRMFRVFRGLNLRRPVATAPGSDKIYHTVREYRS